MNDKLSLLEELCFATVRIEAKSISGTQTGTGFIFNFHIESHVLPILVTNKHVIAGSSTVSFNLTQAITDPNGWKPDLGKHHNIVTETKNWIEHPSADVDLCFTYWVPAFKQGLPTGVEPFYKCFEKSQIILDAAGKAELDAVEDIIMMGYPNGLWDSINNLPIVRKGTTATHPAIAFKGKKEFMIDAACYPGSSGSPVVLHYKGARGTKNGGTAMGEVLIFLGILYSGPQYNAQGDIVFLTIPSGKLGTSTNLMLNLGNVIFAEELMGFEDIIRKQYEMEMAAQKNAQNT